MADNSTELPARAELSFSVQNSQRDACGTSFPAASTPGFMGELQLLAGEELEARLQVGVAHDSCEEDRKARASA